MARKNKEEAQPKDEFVEEESGANEEGEVNPKAGRNARKQVHVEDAVNAVSGDIDEVLGVVNLTEADKVDGILIDTARDVNKAAHRETKHLIRSQERTAATNADDRGHANEDPPNAPVGASQEGLEEGPSSRYKASEGFTTVYQTQLLTFGKGHPIDPLVGKHLEEAGLPVEKV